MIFFLRKSIQFQRGQYYTGVDILHDGVCNFSYNDTKSYSKVEKWFPGHYYTGEGVIFRLYIGLHCTFQNFNANVNQNIDDRRTYRQTDSQHHSIWIALQFG